MTQWRKILAHRPESDLQKPSKGRLETPPFPQASSRQRDFYHEVKKLELVPFSQVLGPKIPESGFEVYSSYALKHSKTLGRPLSQFPQAVMACPITGHACQRIKSAACPPEIPPLSLCPSQTPDLIPPPFLQRMQRLPAGPETTLANHQHTRWVPTMRGSPCLTLSAWPGTGSWGGQRPTVDPNTLGKKGGGGGESVQ